MTNIEFHRNGPALSPLRVGSGYHYLAENINGKSVVITENSVMCKRKICDGETIEALKFYLVVNRKKIKHDQMRFIMSNNILGRDEDFIKSLVGVYEYL